MPEAAPSAPTLPPGAPPIDRVGVGRADRGPGGGPGWGRRRAFALLFGCGDRLLGAIVAVEAGGFDPAVAERALAARGLGGLPALCFASGAPGGPAFDAGLDLEDAVQDAVDGALRDLAPGSLGWGQLPVWGLAATTDAARVLRRRKLERGPGHLRSAEPDAALDRLVLELHGLSSPPGVLWEAALCDPTLGLLLARGPEGALRGALGFVAAREAAPPGPPREGPGVFGRAARLVEAALYQKQRAAVPAMIVASAGGDARLLVPEAPTADPLAGVEQAARRLSAALLGALPRAVEAAALGAPAWLTEAPEGGGELDGELGVQGFVFEQGALLSGPAPATPLLLSGLRRGGLRPLALGARRVRGTDPLPDGLKAALDRNDRLSVGPIGGLTAPAVAPAARPAPPPRAPSGPRRAPGFVAKIRGEKGAAEAVFEGDLPPGEGLSGRGAPTVCVEVGARRPAPPRPGGAKPKNPPPPLYDWSPLLWGGLPVDDLHQTFRVGEAGGLWRWRLVTPLPPRWRGEAFRAVVAGVPSSAVVLK